MLFFETKVPMPANQNTLTQRCLLGGGEGLLRVSIPHRGREVPARLRAARSHAPAVSPFVARAVCICDLGLQVELSTDEKIVVYVSTVA